VKGEVVISLEPGHLAGGLASQARLDGQIEKDGQVRLEAAAGNTIDRTQRVERDAGPETLVGECRVRIPCADDRRSVGDRRSDDPLDELAAGRLEQERIGQWIDRLGLDASLEEQLAETLTEPGSSGFAGDEDLAAASPQVRRQSLDLGRLARTLGSLDRDEPARSGRLSAGGHGRSVAEPDPGLRRLSNVAGGRTRRPTVPGKAAGYDAFAAGSHATGRDEERTGRNDGGALSLGTHESTVHHAQPWTNAATLRRVGGTFLAVAMSLAVVGAVAAHPLGNFTINHYAGIRVEPDRLLLDVVIDQAEIPAFQARQELDADGDGEISDRELDDARVAGCRGLGDALSVLVADVELEPELTRAGLTFPPGAGGLATMRLVCGFEARFPAELVPGTRIGFADTSHADRIGWREIVVEPSGVTVEPIDGELRDASVSARLTEYPDALVERPLVDRSILFAASPGGPTKPASTIPDAHSVAGPTDDEPAPSGEPGGVGVVPGGIGGDLPEILQATDMTPLVVLAAMLAAAALGAGHALTPGHGKTLMAAYLVGSRGRPIHAIGLGLSVSVSHTLGILLLALVVIAAQGFLAPDVVVRIAPTVAALTIVGIGTWMLAGELRRRGQTRTAHPAPDHRGEGERYPHSHAPEPGSTITWRSLFVLGLAGGLIPSTNALIVLLGSIASGRPGFGLVLVVAFGLGMALVMAGVGLLMILARGRLDRFRVDSPAGRLRGWLPLGAAVFVLGLGLYLTIQTLAVPPVL